MAVVYKELFDNARIVFVLDKEDNSWKALCLDENLESGDNSILPLGQGLHGATVVLQMKRDPET